MTTLQLPNVTLFAVACTKIDKTIHALRASMNGIRFHETLLFTHEPRALDRFDIKVIPIEQLDYKGYNHFVLYRLPEYMRTDFSLLVQNDGYVLRPDRWDNRFFDYDYIGAPWSKNVHFTDNGINVRVGNGGFSFRSQKLLQAFNTLQLPFTDNATGFYHEDGIISVYYRKQLEDYGIRFAPVDIASRFSREVMCDDSYPYPFGFHNKKNIPRLFFLRPWIKKFNIEI